MAAEGFGQDQPPLGLGEDAGIFLGAGVVDYRQGALKGMGVVGRVHEHRAVGGVQPVVDLGHGPVGLVLVRQPADDRPAIRISIAGLPR